MPSGAVSVAAPTRWASMFLPAAPSAEAHTDAVAQFADWLSGQHALVAQARRHLVDLDLACWCPPDFDCHADIWLRVANEPVDAFPMAPAAIYPRTIAELPPGRKQRLLKVGAVRSQGCDLWPQQRCSPPLGARLADDGRFHLIGDSGQYDCAADADSGHSFKHEYRWFEWDRWRLPPRIAPPTEAERRSGFTMNRTLTWLDETRTEVSLIPRRDRCPLAAEHWPGYTGSTERDPHAQTRRWLVRQLGQMCHSCGMRRACIIDHDTGLVRGYVCHHCNTRMDNCLHLSGCPWADYLNNPPALTMKLPYKGTTERISPIADHVLSERESAANVALSLLAAG